MVPRPRGVPLGVSRRQPLGLLQVEASVALAHNLQAGHPPLVQVWCSRKRPRQRKGTPIALFDRLAVHTTDFAGLGSARRIWCSFATCCGRLWWRCVWRNWGRGRPKSNRFMSRSSQAGQRIADCEKQATESLRRESLRDQYLQMAKDARGGRAGRRFRRSAG